MRKASIIVIALILFTVSCSMTKAGRDNWQDFGYVMTFGLIPEPTMADGSSYQYGKSDLEYRVEALEEAIK